MSGREAPGPDGRPAPTRKQEVATERDLALAGAAERARRLTALSELAVALMGATSPGAALELATGGARQICSARRCLALLEGQDAAGAAWAPPDPGATEQAEGARLDRLVRAAGRALRGAGPGSEPPFGWAGAPLHGPAGRLLGTIQVWSDRGLEVEEEALLVQVAEALAAALERLRLEERLRRADLRKAELLATVSHDLRSSLGVIAMSTALLVRNAGEDEAGQRLARWARSAERATADMTRLIADLLDASSYDDGALRLELIPHDAGELLRQAVERVAPLLRDRGLRLRSDAPPPGALTLCCDPIRLDRVLVNLLGNAIRFSPPGGEVVVRAEPVPEGPETPVAARFSVRDQGPGLAPADRERVFQRYGAGGVGTGPGLGLFIARAIVEAHGGRLWVEDVAPHGSEFRFSIPLAGL